MSEFFNKAHSFRNLILFLGLIAPLVYIAGICSLSSLSGMDFNQLILYRYMRLDYPLPHLTNYLIRPITVLSGLLLLLFFPGILFVPLFIKNKTNFGLTKFFLLGFILNIFLLLSGTTLLKIAGITINRFWLMTTILTGTITGLFFFRRISMTFRKYNFTGDKNGFIYFFLLCFIMTGFILFFQNEVFYTLPVNFDYNQEALLNTDFTEVGDPIEEFGIAHYLKDRLLPHWLIFSLNKFGVYLDRPHLSYFFYFLAGVLFGESYASFNLVALALVLGIFLFTYKIIGIGNERVQSPLVYLGPGLFMFNFLLMLTVSSRRNGISFMVWPENILSDITSCLWLFLLMGFIFFLLKRDSVFMLIFSFLATFCRYETVPCIFILVILAYYFFRENRNSLKKFIRYYAFFLIFFTAYSLILCLSQGGGWSYLSELVYNKLFLRFDFTRHFVIKNFGLVTVEEQIRGYFTWANLWKFISLSLRSSYFFIVLFMIPSRDRIVSFLSVFGIIYFISVAAQSLKLVTYVCPLVPLASINIRRYISAPVRVRLYNLMIYIMIWLIGVRYLGF